MVLGSLGKMSVVINAKDRASPKMAAVQGRMRSMAGVAATTGAAVAGLGAVAGGVAVKEFSGFDDALNQSMAIMGDMSEQMENEMSDAAREVAKTTRFSAEEAAESYFFLASAGMDAKESMEAMPAVADFAQAGMFDMATATDLATDAQSALGMTSEDTEENIENLGQVTDTFVKANQLANASVEEFSEAMTNKLGPRLRDLNKDIDEGTAALAALADQGVKGRKAGRQLNILFRDLASGAEDNADAFEELGIQVFDSEGNMRNMADIMEDFEDATMGMSDQAKQAALSQLGLNRQAQDAVKQLSGTSETLREYQGELNDAGGAAEEVADNQMQSLSAQLDILKSHVRDVFIGVGSQLAPAVAELAEGFKDAIPAMEEFGSALAEGDFGQAGGMLEGLAGKLIDALRNQMQRTTQMLNNINFRNLGSSLVNGIFDSIVNIFQRQGQGEAENFGQVIVNFIGAALGASLDLLAGLTSGVADVAGKLNNLLVNWLETDGPEQLGRGIANMVADAYTALVSFISGGNDGSEKGAAEIVGNLVKNLMKLSFQLYMAAVEITAGFIQGFIDSAGPKMLDAWKEHVFNPIKSVIDRLISGAAGWASDMIGNFVGGIKDAVKNKISDVKDAASKIKEYFGGSPPETGPLYEAWTKGPEDFVGKYQENLNRAMRSSAIDVQMQGPEPGSVGGEGGQKVVIQEMNINESQDARQVARELETRLNRAGGVR